MKLHGTSPDSEMLTKGGSLSAKESRSNDVVRHNERPAAAEPHSARVAVAVEETMRNLQRSAEGRLPNSAGAEITIDSRDDALRCFLREALTRRVLHEREGSVGRPEESADTGHGGDQVNAVSAVSDVESPATPAPGEGRSALPDSAMGVVRWKRALDLGVIAATSPLWFPLMLIVMIAVRLSSPGPIFFRQRRVGFKGRSFMIYKFRSMRVDVGTGSHESHFERLMRQGIPMVKLDASDPRIIPWGRMLRATGLDELPQIFNVIKGEMSLVGPRPSTIQEFQYFRPYERQRVEALPGLTGYWQVNGKNHTTFDEMIQMDIYYARNVSIRLDLAIIARTIPVLLAQTLELRAKRSGRTKEGKDISAQPTVPEHANSL